MKSIGISSALITNPQLVSNTYPHELSTLFQHAILKYDEIYAIDPRRVLYFFEQKELKPKILYENKDISNLSTLIIRGTTGRETAFSILAHAFHSSGCDIIDPLDRFSGASASKLLTTVKRHRKKVGTDSYFAFSKDNAIAIVNKLDIKNMFPLISKPIHGKRGVNVKILETLQDSLEHIDKFYSQHQFLDEPFFLQVFVKFVKEYRAFVVGGKCIGIVEKRSKDESYILNAAQGGNFKMIQDEETTDFVEKNVSAEGILGVDVAIDNKGHHHIIEANRAPLWDEFEKATGINVAERIIEYAYRRIS